jgi:serine/threonine protein kinase
MSEKEINMRGFEGAVIDGRYRLVQYLNEGKFGAVYRAAHVVYEVELREVAVKIAKRPMTNSEARRVFAEALLMTKLTELVPDATLRDHFVTVYDAGRCPDGGVLAGHPYMVMEFVPGGSLRGHLREFGPFPLTRAMMYFEHMLKAVAFMHTGCTDANGERTPIVHRDIKPGNVLVVRRKEGDLIKISDFGLAIEVDSLLGWAESGGDLAYLAPESFSYKICSPRSDVYVLGLLFYEMVTGDNPFSEVGAHLWGDEEEKRQELSRLHLRARQTETFDRLEAHVELKRLPAIAAVVRAALEPDMNSRKYADAHDLLVAWQKAKRQSAPPPQQEHAWDKVLRLTHEAQDCFAVGDHEHGDELLNQALEINQKDVPDHMMVGWTYLLIVERLIERGEVKDAGRLAAEGDRRRRCRSTYLAQARCYEANKQHRLATSLGREANRCKDQS